jgi:hypothetical protein
MIMLKVMDLMHVYNFKVIRIKMFFKEFLIKIRLNEIYNNLF